MFQAIIKQSLLRQFLLPTFLACIFMLLLATSLSFKHDLENLEVGAKVEVGELADVLQLVEALDADDINDGMKEVENHYLQHGQPRLNGYISGAAGRIPKLQFGEFSVAGNANLIETFIVRPKDLVTVFVKHNNHFVRIASTVKTEDGSRTEFTKLRTDNPAYPQLAAGRAYRGIISNFGKFHLSYYKPIVDSDNKVIGVLHFGKQIDLEDLSEVISHWQYLGTGFAAITDQHKAVIFHSRHASIALAKQALYGKPKDWVVVSEHVPNWQLTIHMVYAKEAAYKKILENLFPLIYIISLLALAALLIFKKSITRYVLEPLGGDPVTANKMLTKIQQGDLDDDGVEAPTGTVIHHIVKMRTYLKNVKEQELLSAKALSISASVFDHAQNGIFICDNQFNLININPAFSSITGYSQEATVNLNLSEVGFEAAINYFLSETHADEVPIKNWAGETSITCADSTVIVIELELVLVNIVNENPYYIGLFTNITDAIQQQQKLQHLAFHDALTDTANRVLFTKLLNERIDNIRPGDKIAVCYIDLDNFKWINDQHGHHTGDQLLMRVASRLINSVRSDDVVARLGGDEFALLLCSSDSVLEYELILNRLLELSKQPVTINKLQFISSFSIGCTIYPDDNVEPDMLLRHADQAMYLAKAQGGARFKLFDTATAKEIEVQYRLEDDVLAGLENNQFQLHYQPKINLTTGEVIGFEALIRWDHPSLGKLAPSEFITAIENTPAIIALGEWVIAESLAQLAKWKAEQTHTKIAINISAHHITEPTFVSKIKAQFDMQPEVSYDMVDIEITETSIISDINRVHQVIQECCDLGLTFSIDDFGAGYSSINYLRKLSAHTIKIDKDFVLGMNDKPSDFNLVKSIISICEDFERFSLAEGVETHAQFTHLKAMGCQFAQGYYIAKPMPAKQVPKWLKSNSPFKL